MSYSGSSERRFIFNTLCFLIVIFVDHTNSHFRGPHHPRGQASSEPSHQHIHYVPNREPGHQQVKLTQDKELLHDKEHLKEDMGEWAFKDGVEPTDEEMETYYFQMHDFDNNSKLDGLEILQAISHILPMTEPKTTESGNPSADDMIKKEDILKQKDIDFSYYIELIDNVLEEDDLDKDGFLSYAEYTIGRKRENEKNSIKLKPPTASYGHHKL